MNRLALGTAQFGLPYGIANSAGQVRPEEARAMLAVAAEAGIDTLDTAMAYGDSEARLGQLPTAGFHIITKLPPVPPGAEAAAWVRGQLDASMGRLGRHNVQGLLLHRPSQLLEPGGSGLWRALEVERHEGRAMRIGVSVYSPEELAAVAQGRHLDLVQVPHNLIDRRFQESGWLQRLKDEGVEIHVRSVFLQGLLLVGVGKLPPRFAAWMPLWRRWQDWLDRERVNPLAACLAHALASPEIDRVVVGADSAVQLGEIVDAAARPPAIAAWPDIASNDDNLVMPSRWSVA